MVVVVHSPFAYSAGVRTAKANAAVRGGADSALKAAKATIGGTAKMAAVTEPARGGA